MPDTLKARMQLTQLLLPLYGNEGERFAAQLFDRVRHDLTRRFGGLTVYARAPADGLWQPEQQAQVVSDELIIFEVMSKRRHKNWWRRYRLRLQRRFRQEQILIRTQKIRIL